VCSAGGRFWSHSIEDEKIKLLIKVRKEEIDSQIINLNKITATTEVYLPKEDTIFHEVKASG
jgi:hypothetical protein